MKNRLGVIASFLVCGTIFYSCGKQEDKCVSTANAFVDSVQGPATGNVNTDITFNVFFGIGNGCGRFTGFDKSQVGNIVTVRTGVKYEGCICTDIYQMANESFVFRPASAGTYTIQFIKGDLSSVVEKEIVVQ